jgi:hypothetical protein
MDIFFNKLFLPIGISVKLCLLVVAILKYLIHTQKKNFVNEQPLIIHG